MMQEIRKDLLDILACPKCKTPVVQQDDRIVCTNTDCRLSYPVRDGIPHMLIEEAEPAETTANDGS